MEQSIYYPFVHVITEWTLSNFLTQAVAAIIVCGLVLLVKSVLTEDNDI